MAAAKSIWPEGGFCIEGLKWSAGAVDAASMRSREDEALKKMGAELERRIVRGGADIGGARLHSLDYPVIGDFDAG